MIVDAAPLVQRGGADTLTVGAVITVVEIVHATVPASFLSTLFYEEK